MRYLKVVAKDQSLNNQADTVNLFFIQRSPSLPDELVRSATAVDVTADGLVDYQITGDINGNGVSGEQDRELLKKFANNVLKVNWLSRPAGLFRSINMYVSRFDKATKPAEVRLDFYQNEKPMNGKDKLMFSFTASDSVGKGSMKLDEEVTSYEAFDTSDREALQGMISLYLKFDWQ
ncbi:hypothetical protein BK649_08290 [Pseudomonas canadensis]|uniref:Uncharacterized protein n=1 Tax=Pseudomonas canadensis TaxID=915099 RepID=A0A423FCU3_9PSED|nr:hypothetical protein [Pseudomonas canadensis]ROM54853.1 hypothetical protein BK649_08290 [Pseudomonas canadensis]